jgi:hypothetical protein
MNTPATSYRQLENGGVGEFDGEGGQDQLEDGDFLVSDDESDGNDVGVGDVLDDNEDDLNLSDDEEDADSESDDGNDLILASLQQSRSATSSASPPIPVMNINNLTAKSPLSNLSRSLQQTPLSSNNTLAMLQLSSPLGSPTPMFSPPNPSASSASSDSLASESIFHLRRTPSLSTTGNSSSAFSAAAAFAQATSSSSTSHLMSMSNLFLF